MPHLFVIGQNGERATITAFQLADNEFPLNPGREKRILLVTDGNMFPFGENLVLFVHSLKQSGKN